MTRLVARLLLAVALLGIGWTAGRAQQPLHDFELVVDAPSGQTTITCVRGCQGLAWIERMVPGTVPVPSQTTFMYGCSGSSTARCGSGRIGGWLER